MGKVVIIAGMHRSGTSLLANLLARCGVDVGDRLQAASDSNRKGHFEDLDFQNLQRAILHDADPRLLYDAPVDVRIPISETRRREALDLIDDRDDRPVWGFKDPRTTLFLDLWFDLVPDACFVFVFRRPDLVVNSLRRRGDRRLLHKYPWAWFMVKSGLGRFRLTHALGTWRRYNERVLDFMARHPDRSILVQAEHLDEHLPVALRHMRDRWDVPVDDTQPDDVIDPSLMSRRAPWLLTIATWLRPSTWMTWRRLRRATIWAQESSASVIR